MHVVNEVQGNWHSIKGFFRQGWGRFIDNEIEIMDGKRDKLIGSLMTKFGMTKLDAEQQILKFWSKH